jgi:RecA-family ATPase
MPKFYCPSYLAAYEPPENVNLVGEGHLQRGGTAILGGAAGIGKSFAVTNLAVAGVTGEEWFGLKVHEQFKTLMIQGENSLSRLKEEFAPYDTALLDDWIRVSESYIDFSSSGYMASVGKEIKSFDPDCIILDPWNHIVTLDNIESCTKAIKQIETLRKFGSKERLILIVAHTRKPKPDNKPSGRDLLHEISGSLKLGSYARAAFVMESIKDDNEKSSIRFTCCKNNNGELGVPSIWKFDKGKFTKASDVTEAFSPKKKKGITKEHLKEALATPCQRKVAVLKLQAISGQSGSSCYKVFHQNSPLFKYLVNDNGLLRFKDCDDPDQTDSNSNSTKSPGGDKNNNDE